MILWRAVALVLAALSLGLSFCHLMQMPVRLRWDADLWMAATNFFGGLYALFGSIGAVIDVGAIVFAFMLAIVTRPGDSSASRMAVAGAAVMAIGLAIWWAFVAPMNTIMADWTRHSIPADFDAVRFQWETAHAVIAGVKLGGFVLLLLSSLVAPVRSYDTVRFSAPAMRRH